MSIADKITQLTNIRTAIRTALQNKGVAAAVSHNFADFAADIASIVTGVTLQSKRVSASTSRVVTVTPDSGYDGLSQVKVNAILRQAKTVTPGTADQTVSPDSGYQGLSSVTVEGDADLVAGNIKSGVEIFGVTGSYAPAGVTLQSKSVTPSASAQTVVADSGYDGLSQVVVSGDADLIASNIKRDVEIFGVTGTLDAGSAENGIHYAEASNAAGGTTVTLTSTARGEGMTHTSTLDSGGGYIEAFSGYENGKESGSLIVCDLATAINRVVAAYGSESVTALIQSHVAYINIPYPFTSGTVTITAYVDSQPVTSGTVTIDGINKYTCPLTV